MSQHLARTPGLPPWLAELADEWHLQATEGFGYGVVAGLDGWLVNDDRRRLLAGVFAEVRAEFAARGRDFTRAEMEAARLGGDCIHGRDYTLGEILDTADGFLDLVADEPRARFVE